MNREGYADPTADRAVLMAMGNKKRMDVTKQKTELQKTYDYLSRIRWKEQQIHLKRMRRDALQSCLLPKAITYDGDKVQTTPDDSLAEIAGQVIDLEKQIRKMEREKAGLIVEISDAIAGLDNSLEQLVLMGYYVSGKSMQTIANDIIGRSLRWTFILRNRAVEHLSKTLH